eukprot:1150739-Lingulodinium_polyedra.AAC.1
MFRCRSGSQIARSRAPCADRFLVRAWSARACGLRARRGSEMAIQPRRSAAFRKRRATTWSNECCVVAVARKLDVR